MSNGLPIIKGAENLPVNPPVSIIEITPTADPLESSPE